MVVPQDYNEAEKLLLPSDVVVQCITHSCVCSDVGVYNELLMCLW